MFGWENIKAGFNIFILIDPVDKLNHGSDFQTSIVIWQSNKKTKTTIRNIAGMVSWKMTNGIIKCKTDLILSQKIQNGQNITGQNKLLLC